MPRSARRCSRGRSRGRSVKTGAGHALCWSWQTAGGCLSHAGLGTCGTGVRSAWCHAPWLEQLPWQVGQVCMCSRSAPRSSSLYWQLDLVRVTLTYPTRVQELCVKVRASVSSLSWQKSPRSCSWEHAATSSHAMNTGCSVPYHTGARCEHSSINSQSINAHADFKPQKSI